MRLSFKLILVFSFVGLTFGCVPAFASVQCKDCLSVEPTMTADNLPTPYVVSADSVYDTNSAWKAFDNDEQTYWHSGLGALPHWLKLDLGSGGSVSYKSFRYLANNYYPVDFVIQGSTNDSDWVDLLTITDDYNYSSANFSRWYDFSDNFTDYRYYRLYITDTISVYSYSLIISIEFSATHSDEPDVFTDYTPIMTSNSLPTPYIVSADSELSPDYLSYEAFNNLFDDIDTGWHSASGHPHWLKLDLGFGNDVSLNAFRFLGRKIPIECVCYPYDFVIQGSTNDSYWYDLVKVGGLQPSALDEWSPYFFSDSELIFRYYRFYITDSSQDRTDAGGSAYAYIDEWELKQVDAGGGAGGDWGDIPFEFCDITDVVIDLGAYNNFYDCSAEGGYWDMFQQKCFEYDCSEVSWDYSDLYGYDMICEVDLETVLLWKTNIHCILNGGYWFQDTCYDMNCESGYSSADFGFDSDYSTSTLANLEVPDFLSMFISDDVPQKVVGMIQGFRTILMERFPFNVITQYISFWYQIYNNITEVDTPYSLEADMAFFPGSATTTYTVVNFDIAGMADEPITIFGVEFDSFYSFGRSIMRFFLALVFGFYCIRFANRLFSNTN